MSLWGHPLIYFVGGEYMRIADLPMYHVFWLGRKRYYRVDGRYVWDMREGRRGELKLGMEVESVRPVAVKMLLEKMVRYKSEEPGGV